MKIKSITLAAASLCAVQMAFAQASNSYFESLTDFTFTTSSASLTVELDPNDSGGDYQLFAPDATGDGANTANAFDRTTDLVTGSIYAACGSHTTVNGTADNSQGENYYFLLTNNSNSTETIQWDINSLKILAASGDSALTVGYGGWELNGYDIYAFATDTLDQDGNPSLYPGSGGGASAFDDNYIGNGVFQATNSYVYTMGAGETATLQIWASGETHATSPVPEPASMVVLGLGLLAAVGRRRKR